MVEGAGIFDAQRSRHVISFACRDFILAEYSKGNAVCTVLRPDPLTSLPDTT
jgi:hypothetical protein